MRCTAPRTRETFPTASCRGRLVAVDEPWGLALGGVRRALLVATVFAAGLFGDEPAQAAFPGANGRIAFDMAPGPLWDNRDIYSIQPDDSGLLRLTTDPAVDASPAWSSEGDRLAFI